MKIETELRDLAELLDKLQQSCDRLAALADHMNPGQFRAALLGIGEAMGKYRTLIAATLTLAETPDP